MLHESQTLECQLPVNSFVREVHFEDGIGFEKEREEEGRGVQRGSWGGEDRIPERQIRYNGN